MSDLSPIKEECELDHHDECAHNSTSVKHKEKETVDTEIDFSSFYQDLLNNFIKHHHATNDSNKNMFEGCDTSDITSTNFIMEEFYKLMTINQSNNKYHSDRLKVYTKGDKRISDLKESESLYSLQFTDDSDKEFYCQDLLTLLQLATQEEFINWKIITIK
jgi:hypothetical protein